MCQSRRSSAIKSAHKSKHVAWRKIRAKWKWNNERARLIFARGRYGGGGRRTGFWLTPSRVLQSTDADPLPKYFEKSQPRGTILASFPGTAARRFSLKKECSPPHQNQPRFCPTSRRGIFARESM